ncbi:DUF4097 family beta strand repeat-containing protein [Micrococcoides hystricis]|uniref:DUF4097 family beta strand repeat-containing protein n=1 Tax=Micrococcoides hystricis TaxID=1572761 RepID=A0ABV6P8T6_9MICC
MTQQTLYRPTPPAGAPTDPAQRTSAVSMIFTVLGGLCLFFMLLVAILNIGAVTRAGSSFQSADIRGINAVVVDAADATVEVKFADIDKAELQLTNTDESKWHFGRENQTLLLSKSSSIGFCVFNCGIDRDNVVLTLPQELSDGSLAGDFTVSSGSIEIAGNYAQFSLNVDAGSGSWVGQAHDVNVEVNAGRADIQADDVSQAALRVSAGRLSGTLSGNQPENTELEVNAGRLDVRLPQGTYHVETDEAAGSVEERLQHDPTSPHRVSISVSAGSATVR